MLLQSPLHQDVNSSGMPGPSGGPPGDSCFSSTHPSDSPTAVLQRRTELFRALMPLAYDTTIIDVIKERENFPLVTTWKSGKKSDGNSTLGWKMKFLVYDTGVLVEEARVNAMRADLRNIFQQVLKYMPEALEATWTGHDMAFQEVFYKYIRRKYVVFTLCENNWKARTFVSLVYGNWIKNCKDTLKKQAVKSEPIESEVAESRIPSKRKFLSTSISPNVQRRRLDTPSPSLANVKIKNPLYGFDVIQTLANLIP